MFTTALTIINAGPTYAQVYKWIDEKGITQYSSSPPPGKGQKIINTPAPGATAKPIAKEKTWQEKEIEFRERQATAHEKQTKDDAERKIAQREQAAKRASCIDAHTDLQSLNEKRAVYSLNERGERVYLEDKDRPRMIEELKRTIASDCPK